MNNFFQHLQYKACEGTVETLEAEEFIQTVTDTFAELQVRVPFSTYDVSVTAITISPGEPASHNFDSPPRGISWLVSRCVPLNVAKMIENENIFASY